MFRFMLKYEDGDDAGTLVTAVPNWRIGETCMIGDGHSFRIVGMVDDAYLPPSADVSGIWVVEDA